MLQSTGSRARVRAAWYAAAAAAQRACNPLPIIPHRFPESRRVRVGQPYSSAEAAVLPLNLYRHHVSRVREGAYHDLQPHRIARDSTIRRNN